MEIEQKSVNVLRKLALDMIGEAKSGHVGIALGAAPLMMAIYSEANIDPSAPEWPNRDRIVMSSGHGSALLYAALHVFGYDVGVEDLKKFRQLGSITPGHPETKLTPGVDVSTGALGQGFATAVGLAMAEKHLSSYNRDKYEIINHYTYVLCGDGDLMEGVSYEAASIAGKESLNKLIVIYDSNSISMTGSTALTFCDDVEKRFEALGWNVICADGEDVQDVRRAVKEAQSSDKPNLIICKTVIGVGSPLAGSEKVHGNPYKAEDFKKIIHALGVGDEPFKVERDVYKHCASLTEKGKQARLNWDKTSKLYRMKYRSDYFAIFEPDLEGAQKAVRRLRFNSAVSTREAGGKALNALYKHVPTLFGGCADVASSTMAYIDGGQVFGPTNPRGANIAFGVREHAMSAIVNGIALHGIRTFASTFLIFSDYMRYSMRMSAMMDLPVLYALTHDSISVGEDGASHQPVEQIESLRLMPNMTVFRPADAKETCAGYALWLNSSGPVSMILSRQNLPVLDSSSVDDALRGGYIVGKECRPKELNAIIVATGSEVELALHAKEIIERDGELSVRVVSMPCRELFLKQDAKYQEKVLPSKFPAKLFLEAGVPNGWQGLAKTDGRIFGITEFGKSGKPADLKEYFGFTLPNIIKAVDELVKTTKTKIESIIM